MSTSLPAPKHPESAIGSVVRWVSGWLLLMLAIPVLAMGMLLAPWGRIVKTPCITRGGQAFSLLSWRWSGRLGLWLNQSALAGWPRVFQLFTGQLAWVGLYPHPATVAAPNAELARLVRDIKPGVFSLWGLRHRTGTDYDDLWVTQLEYARSRSLRYDYKLFFDNILAMALHPLPTRTHAPSVVIDTLRVDNLDMSAAIERIVQQLSLEGQPAMQVSFVKVAGVNHARRNAKYRTAVNQADLCLPEGLSVRRAASWLGTPLAQRVDRMALAPKLWAALAGRGAKVYLLGGEEGEAVSLAKRLRHEYPGLMIVGAHDCLPDANPADIVSHVNASGADVLFTGMPFAVQEPWIAGQRSALRVKVIVGLASAFGALATDMRAADALDGWLKGHLGFTLAVVLQRWLGSVKPLREMPVVVRPGDVKAPGNAVVLISSQSQDDLLKPFDVVPALLPVGAPRAVTRVMELLAEKGCRHVDIVTDVDVVRLRECLGHGERWGLSIEFHLVEDERDLLQRCAQLPVLNESEAPDSDPRDHLVWLIDAACWLPDGALGTAVPEDEQVWTKESPSQWAGWACLARPNLRQCFQAPRDWAELEAAVIHLLQGQATRRTAEGEADLRTMAGIMTMVQRPTMGILEPANWHRLAPSEYPGVEGEVWVSREALLEPGVQLTGPVYIGPGSHVASNAVLGPGVILGRNVRIGSDLSLSDVVVLDGVRLDGGLDIRQSLVDERGIANHAWNVVVPAHALGSLLTGSR